MRIYDINWGGDSAESDPNLLEYFVESEALKRILQKQKPIVIGRKGSGKSALRKKAEDKFKSKEDNLVIPITPEGELFNIKNSQTTINEYNEEIFFRYIWIQYILKQSLCKAGDNVKGLLVTGSREFARQVSRTNNETSNDLVEYITTLISKLEVKVSKFGELGVSFENQLKDDTDLYNLKHHFQTIANTYNNIIIFIDDLDVGWDNSKLANNFLLGLLSACDHISALSNQVYYCIFIREDVYSILMTQTQHSDKWRNIEEIRWTKPQLLEILNTRINFNRKQHNLSEKNDPFETVFPAMVGPSNTDNWLLERTLWRPRELLQFARIYTENLPDNNPNAEVLKERESKYSNWKLDDLCTEYKYQYPSLKEIFKYWRTYYRRCKYQLERDEVDSIILDILDNLDLEQSWFKEIKNNIDTYNFLDILYEIGFIRDVVNNKEFHAYFTPRNEHLPIFEEISIHPCFRKAIDTRERMKSQNT